MNQSYIRHILEEWEVIPLKKLLHDLNIHSAELEKYGIKIRELDEGWSFRCPSCRITLDRGQYVAYPTKCTNKMICQAWIGTYLNIQEKKYCIFAVNFSGLDFFDFINRLRQ